jgi:hypothetical protein
MLCGNNRSRACGVLKGLLIKELSDFRRLIGHFPFLLMRLSRVQKLEKNPKFAMICLLI